MPSASAAPAEPGERLVETLWLALDGVEGGLGGGEEGCGLGLHAGAAASARRMRGQTSWHAHTAASRLGACFQLPMLMKWRRAACPGAVPKAQACQGEQADAAHLILSCSCLLSFTGFPIKHSRHYMPQLSNHNHI